MTVRPIFLITYAALTAVAAAFPRATLQQANLSPKQIYAKFSDSVVQVESELQDGEIAVGTGFFFGNKGQVVTCFHVVKNGKNLKVLGTHDSAWTVKSVEVDEKSDCAILLIADAASGRTPIPMGQYREVSPGDAITVIGNPLGLADLKNSLTTGVVGGKRDAEGIAKLQFSAAVSNGNSGSPIISATGRVIAFVDYKLESGDSLNFGVAIDSAKALLNKGHSMPIAELAASSAFVAPPGSLTPPRADPKELYGAVSDKLASWATKVQDVETKLGLAAWEYPSSADSAVTWFAAVSDCNKRLLAALKDHVSHDEIGDLLLSIGPEADILGKQLDELVTSSSELCEDLANAGKRVEEDWVYKNKGSAEVHADINHFYDVAATLQLKINSLLEYGGSQKWSDEKHYYSHTSASACAAPWVTALLGVFPDPESDSVATVGGKYDLDSPFNKGDVIKSVLYSSVTTPLPDWKSVAEFLKAHQGDTCAFAVSRDSSFSPVTIQVRIKNQ